MKCLISNVEFYFAQYAIQRKSEDIFDPLITIPHDLRFSGLTSKTSFPRTSPLFTFWSARLISDNCMTSIWHVTWPEALIFIAASISSLVPVWLDLRVRSFLRMGRSGKLHNRLIIGRLLASSSWKVWQHKALTGSFQCQLP